MILPWIHYSKQRCLLLALFLVSFLFWAGLRGPGASFLTQLQRPIFRGHLGYNLFNNNSLNPGAPNLKTDVVYNLQGHQRFWSEFEPLLVTHKPDCPSPIKQENAPTIRFKTKDPEERPNLLVMPNTDKSKMKNAHHGFLKRILAKPPQLSYVTHSRGIVSTAGGSYLPVLVISLRMLRKTGSSLPVEVFLSDDTEYEPYICDVVLPYLNAQCRMLYTVLKSGPVSSEIQKYQFKPFAMLFSSFEEILFLDADAFPLVDPNVLFTSEPFRNRSMLTWPDFWGPTVSPLYYEIASRKVPPMELRQSTESGEVIISKRTHLKTLLLCAYYNYYGPSHYYSLLSQGAAGEGDKETFVSAAETVGEPFYQVSEPLRALGHPTEKGLAGSAMVQFDPAEDYNLTQQGEWRVAGNSKAPSPRPVFIHANFPKFNPATVFTEQSVNPAFADDGSFTRAWTVPEDTIPLLNDVEREFWREIMWTACELEDKFNTWADYEGICADVMEYWDNVFA